MTLIFQIKKLRNLQVDGFQTWLMLEAIITWSKKPSNVIYET